MSSVSSYTPPLIQPYSSTGAGGGASRDGEAQAIYDKTINDSLKNGWMSARAKDINATIQASKG
ncbi:type III secretion protein [Pseudomonas yamanorum]|nr:type III secretion protein [Pseudomonas yamanorum]